MRHAILAVPVILAISFGCSAPFPTGDLSDIVTNRSATFLSDTAASYSVHGGYGTTCAHPGAHANFNAGSYPVYAVLDGVVSSVDTCSSAGTNDKFDIQLAVGMKGAIPVYFEYSIEPFAGSVCSGNSDYFASKILVKAGDKVKKGQKIATFEAVGSGAHIHFNLKADGATICPEIFPTSIFAAQTGAIFGCPTASANTFCDSLTSSENPTRLK